MRWSVGLGVLRRCCAQEIRNNKPHKLRDHSVIVVDIRNIWAAIPIPRPSSLTQFCQPNHAERQAALAARNMQPSMPSARLFVLQHGHFGDSLCVCVCVSGLPSHAYTRPASCDSDTSDIHFHYMMFRHGGLFADTPRQGAPYLCVS